ncbi:MULTISPECIES: hypothetical protein [unclassified Chryseobacterium]|uniref:hypothetical protein n=1 Tax=unclassified Chryseobacterium TaxID=2593645 RepID=UPI00301A431D
MCTPNTELQFCTCTEGDIFEIKNIYIWSLNRYVGYKEKNPFFFASFVKPVEDFSNTISAQNIISKLNEGNIFDFEYLPKEKDTLDISFNAKNRAEYKYFTIIFRDGIWQKGQNPHYVSVTENIARGEVKVTYKEENEFLKHVEHLKIKYGVEIPESIKVRCANLKDDSQDPIYLAIRNFKEYKTFYHPEFIKYITDKYFNEFHESENSNALQSLLDKAQNTFSLLEKKFISEKIDLSFINKCFNELNDKLECVFTSIPIKDDEYMIIDGRFYSKVIFSKGKRKTYFINKVKKINYEIFKLFKG